MGKETVTQLLEAQKVSYRKTQGGTRQDSNLTKIQDKEKILEATREKKQITYKEIPIRQSADFSVENLQDRREWLNIFKGKNLQPRILHPARLSCIFDGEIKSFTDKQKLKEFNTIKPALQQMLNELL